MRGWILVLLGVAHPAVAQTPPGSIRAGVRQYTAYRTTSPPRIDGRLEDAAWNVASWTETFGDIIGLEEPPPTWRTRAKLVWDFEYLYVAAEMEEPHLWATLTERDAIIYRDHDFEVFLDPDGDGLEYYEIEINALGTVFDLFLPKPYNMGGQARIDWDLPGLRSAVHLAGTLNDPSDQDLGWTVELAIPWAELTPPDARDGPAAPPDTRDDLPAPPDAAAAPPEVGDVWRVNFSRVQWPLDRKDGHYVKSALPSREQPHPEHNWVWSPQGEINMHIPQRWGAVTFRGAPPEGGHR